MKHDYIHGMRLFSIWHQSGAPALNSIEHGAFMDWGDVQARLFIRALYRAALSPTEHVCFLPEKAIL